jgi:hypothetical protein
MIWVKKNFKSKRKNYLVFSIQSDDTSISYSERYARYELVKNEFLKYGLAESQIKMFDLSDPTKQKYMWIPGCPDGIMVLVEPVIRKKRYCDMTFCGH